MKILQAQPATHASLLVATDAGAVALAKSLAEALGSPKKHERIAKQLGFFLRDPYTWRAFFGDLPCETRDETQRMGSARAAALLAAITDLPARWIEDVSTGRRPPKE